jgi:phage baseplate assembly protein W
MTTGIKFPLEISPLGNIVTVSDDELTASHIRHVLSLVPSDLIMRPSYGVPNFVFTPTSAAVASRRVLEELKRRIAGIKLNVTADSVTEGQLLIKVIWEGSEGTVVSRIIR